MTNEHERDEKQFNKRMKECNLKIFKAAMQENKQLAKGGAATNEQLKEFNGFMREEWD